LTRAKRTAHSRLDCARAADRLGVRAADWRVSLETCLDALIGPAK
jgi:dTDP-4-dehydrorhamnose reductase